MRDSITAILIFLLTIVVTVPFTSQLDFNKNTEADRTLIALEMLERGEFVVPYLLGDTYITKPPLYYDLIASTFWLTSCNSEQCARAVSASFSAFGLALFFLFLRGVGYSLKRSLFGVGLLACSAQFFRYSVLAEMDMTFGVACFCAFFGAFWHIQYRSALSLYLGYIWAAVAFLLKGPTVLLFVLAPWWVFECYGWLKQSSFKPHTPQARKSLWSSIQTHLPALGVFVVILTVWLAALIAQVGFSEFWHHFNNEIVRRVIQDKLLPADQRSFFFYFERLPSGLLPSSLLLLFAPLLIRRGERGKNENSEQRRDLLLFCALCVLIPLSALSLASGKSARYIFPAHAATVILLLELAITLWAHPHFRKGVENYLKFVPGALLTIAILVLFVGPILTWTQILAVPAGNWLLFALPSIFLLGVATFLLSKSPVSYGLLLFPVILVVFRLAFSLINAPIQNARKTPTEFLKAVTQRDQRQSEKMHTIFVYEMFDRWVPYYLKRAGFEVERLRPQITPKLSMTKKPIWLLLNLRQEQNRLEEIRSLDPTAEVLEESQVGKEHFALVSFDPAITPQLELQRIFPTEFRRNQEIQVVANENGDE